MNENPRVIPKKATEESFNELHYLVTEDFLRRIKRVEKQQYKILRQLVIG